MQGILKKGTVGILCMAMLSLFAATSCRKLINPDDKGKNQNVITETGLFNTKWKLEGIVNVETGNMTVMEYHPENIFFFTIWFDKENNLFISQYYLYGKFKYELNGETNSFQITDVDSSFTDCIHSGVLKCLFFAPFLLKSMHTISIDENKLKIFFKFENKEYYQLYKEAERRKQIFFV